VGQPLEVLIHVLSCGLSYFDKGDFSDFVDHVLFLERDVFKLVYGVVEVQSCLRRFKKSLFL